MNRRLEAMSPRPSIDARPFQVNLRAVVELLSTNIYSHPSVYLRELIQNGRDAITARAEAACAAGVDPEFTAEQGVITITPTGPDQPELTVHDNGIGMEQHEMAQLLATVGQSSKRDMLDLPRTDRLGQFGIGLLSCFMVSDQIVVDTRPASGGTPSRWVGRSDGTFTVQPLDDSEAAETGSDALPIGTTVRLTPRSDDRALTTYTQAWKLAVHFAEFLPVRVVVDGPRGTDRNVNRDAFFTRGIGGGLGAESSDDESNRGGETAHDSTAELLAFTRRDELARLLHYGTELIGAEPLAAIPLDVPATGTRGTAFVLPAPPSPGARQATRAYLGGLLVSESVPDLLPEWAFFVRAVLDTTGLTPTASREGFVTDQALSTTKREIARIIRQWVVDLAEHNTIGLMRFLAVHDLPLRSLAQHDRELAAIILPHLTFETSAGRMLLSDFVKLSPTVKYTETIAEFRQIAGVTGTERPVLNAGYVYEADLMRMVPEVFPHAEVRQIHVRDVIADLAPVPQRDEKTAGRLERLAASALQDLDCTAEVRAFDPPDVPALYVVDPDILQSMELRRLEESTDGFWGDLMRDMSASGRDGGASRDAEGDAGATGAAGAGDETLGEDAGTLALNWRSSLVRSLGASDDDLVVTRTIRLLYVQAMLAGHNPLRRADRAALNDALSDMVMLSTNLMRADISVADFLKRDD